MDAARTPLPLLVPTKLVPPPPLPIWVERERLLARLSSAAQTRLVLVVAPAGFGKTTLVAQWLLEAQRTTRTAQHTARPAPPFAWLTLDEYDQDGLRFVAYVVGAVERAIDRALLATRALLAAEEPAPLHVLLQALLVDLSALPDGLTLVLDDYHTITAEPVQQLVAYLLRHLPPRCRLVLLSRTDPPLPLARLSAAGQLCVVRAADLRFTEAEAFALLRQRGRPTTDEAAVLALHRQTEGWALALQLALVEQPEVVGEGALPPLARSQLGEYLAWDVLAHQPAEIRETLLALAVPDRFCAGVCAALLGTPEALGDAERRIDEVVRAGLLVVPLDEERRWFRFHHLFRDLLLRQLRQTADAKALRALRLRAAHWFEAAHLLEEAVRLYLDAGDEDLAAALVEREIVPTLGLNILEAPPGSWLRMLPASAIARRPGLALVQARLAEARLDPQTMAASLARIETLLASATEQESLWPTFNGDRLALQGMLNNWQYHPAQALLAFEQALHQPISAALNASMLNHMAVAMVAEGRYGEGVALLRSGSFPPGGTASGPPLVSRYLGLCQIHLQEGEFNALRSDADAMTDLVSTQRLEERWASYAAGFVGRAAYERGDFVAAAEAFHNVVSGGYKLNIARYINCLAGLARIAALQGDTATAARYEQEVHAFAQETGNLVLRDYARACAAWLALVAGNLPTALRLSQAFGPDQMQAFFTFDTPQLVRASVLIAGGGRASLAEAEAVVVGCVAEAERFHRTRHLVLALATQALLRQAQGCPAEALALLERAVGLAAPRAMGRTLLDLGPSLLPLLRTLSERGVARAYLEGLLAREQPIPDAKLRGAYLASGHLPELLTRREQEVLALLAERWSNQEIAERLCITTNTTRKHTSTIYEKLGVNGRREAVAVARALGLLPPT